MLAFFPPLAKMRANHWITGISIIVVTILFYLLLFHSLDIADQRVSPRLQRLEQSGPL
jgi:hypothetical protein